MLESPRPSAQSSGTVVVTSDGCHISLLRSHALPFCTYADIVINSPAGYSTLLMYLCYYYRLLRIELRAARDELRSVMEEFHEIQELEIFKHSAPRRIGAGEDLKG